LRVLPLAAHFPKPLARITYRAAGGDGEVRGIQAIARAFDHLNFAWAFCGWILRLPLIGWVAELISDAVSPSGPEHCNVDASGASAIIPSVEARS
jgi:hypothetical protein